MKRGCSKMLQLLLLKGKNETYINKDMVSFSLI